MEYLSLNLPGYQIDPPGGVPEGGLPKLQNILRAGITVFFIIIVLFALFNLIRAGIQWVSSGGDKETIQKAKGRITFAIIGLFIAFFALFIIRIIGRFFNIPIITP